MVKKEWRTLFKSRFLIVVLLAIFTIPTLYTTIFLSSMWDPYGEVSNLPVAVINNDREAQYQGKQVHIGDDLIKQLKDSNSLSFFFVDEITAVRGLQNGTYYMVLTIPEDFSQNAVSVMDSAPKKMELHYETNPGMNFIASKLCESAMNEIKNDVSKSVTAFYAQNTLSQFQTMENGLNDSLDGTIQLSQGLVDLTTGENKLSTGLGKLSNQLNTFASGMSTLTDGITQYTSGVDTVNSSMATLLDGTNKLSDGLIRLNQSVSGISLPSVSLSADNKNAISTAAVAQVASPSQALSQSISGSVASKLQATLTNSATVSAIAQATEQNPQVQQMEAVLISQGYTQENADQLVSSIVAGTLNAAAGNISASSLNTSMLPGITDTMGKVAAASALSGASGVVDTVNQSMASYQPQFASLKSATQTLSYGAIELQNGASKLQDGIGELSAKNQELISGATSLNDGSKKIKRAVSSLLEGSDALEDGLVKASDGASELSGGISDGLVSLHSSTQNVSDDTYDMFASPVQTKESKITFVQNNGYSMAAYMMTVAMWVASLAFCLLYPLQRAKNDPRCGLAFYGGKASVMAPLAIGFSLLMVGALYLFNGLQPMRMKDTILVACLSAVTFISILYFFNVVFKKVGAYLMFIFMVIQLSASSGTYPKQLSASFVGKIIDYLPFTYSIRAFRSTISGGSSIQPELIVLASILLAFVLLTILYYLIVDWITRRKPRIA